MESDILQKKKIIKLRRATINDLPAIQRIERLSFRDPYPPYYTKALLESLADISLIAEINEKIVGYIFSRIEYGDTGHIISIAVDPRWRRRGIGKALMLEAMKLLKNAGCESVYLEVRVSNHIAINLYRNLGFKIIKRIPRYYRDGEDAFLMQRSL